MSLRDKLDGVQACLEGVRQEIAKGAVLSRTDIAMLYQIKQQLATMRDYAIRQDPINGRQAGVRYGLTEARISQIRSEGL